MSDMSARQIKRYRKQLNMTQAELANKVGVSLMSIRRYETTGENNREPSADLFDKIAEELGTTSDILRGKVNDYEFRDIPKRPTTNNEPTQILMEHKTENDIKNTLERTLDKLKSDQDGLMFSGEPLDDETRELLKASLENSLKFAKINIKQKFNSSAQITEHDADTEE